MKPTNAIYHPRTKENGEQVLIKAPHTPTPIEAWTTPSATAIVTPDGPMPEVLSGIPFKSWDSAPRKMADWVKVAGQADIHEPAFNSFGMAPASGVVVIEPDGRVWLAAPSNGFGGYKQTFPKGRKDHPGISLQANAIKEAYEEAGLRVVVDAHLIDTRRTTTYTRYYVAHRVGGCPSAVGWESQAVFLATMEDLPKMARQQE